MRMNGVFCVLAVCVAIAGFIRRTNGAEPPSGDAVIRSPYGNSEIVIRTTSRLAGAIHSLTWNGREFIDSHDHGRQLQSASNLDAGSKMTGETFNPTEAGSRSDGAGPKSTSRLLHLIADRNTLQTTNQMAFWLRPGEKSGGKPAKNMTTLSNHLLTKRVTIGYRNFANVIQHDVTFSLPVNEIHKFAQFEAVTGYMPPEFSRFETFDPADCKVAKLSDGPGEQSKPVMFSTPTGSHAMAIYSPDQPSPRLTKSGYGRWRFKAQRVVKWNCVFRVKQADGIRQRDFQYRSLIILGTRDDVVETLCQLTKSHR